MPSQGPSVLRPPPLACPLVPRPKHLQLEPKVCNCLRPFSGFLSQNSGPPRRGQEGQPRGMQTENRRERELEQSWGQNWEFLG